MLTIAIFTRGKNKKLLNLIQDFKNQSFQNFKIKIYSDSFFDLKDTDLIYTYGKNISQKRNQAIQECDTKYLLLLDDDNRIYNKKFLENLIFKYQEIEKKYGEIIMSPTIMWRNTDKIQSTGIKFCYLLGKVFQTQKSVKNYKQVKAIGGNSLFSKVKNFKKYKFDENIGFIGEDIDYCYGLREQNVKIFVIDEKIYHQEKNKTLAEKSFIAGTGFKRKIKNRDLFVKKHGNLFQKILFWGFGRWIGIIVWKLKIFLTDK